MQSHQHHSLQIWNLITYHIIRAKISCPIFHKLTHNLHILSWIVYAFFNWLKLQSFCILDICHSIQPGRRSPCVASSLHCRHSICEGVTHIWWFKLQKWSRTNYERLGSAQRFWAEMTLPLEPCSFWWTLGATSFPVHSLHRTLLYRFCSLCQLASLRAECQFSFPGPEMKRKWFKF